MPSPTRTQAWFREHPIVAGLLMVPVVLAVAGLGGLVGDALDLPGLARLALLAGFLVLGLALSRRVTGLMMGPDDA
ncbi:hypothetical protein G5V59_05895 [Nocardioides sp. W3-2-3]|uniref:hypothetical protein n=1 Tax=Nocardioides convexus TaxID=2712224 RepID=UPI00241863C2|nr:hypothetical protein [Nocardioides convexus]NGZ99933.1 hypothetical protein [Nocardioides convexus]